MKKHERDLRMASLNEARTAIARAAYLNNVTPAEIEPLLNYKVESQFNNPDNRRAWDMEIKMAQGKDET